MLAVRERPLVLPARRGLLPVLVIERFGEAGRFSTRAC